MVSLQQKLLAEFVGTYMLVFAVGCNVITGSATWAVTSIACTLMVAIYALGGISGAHLNPAVSFGLAMHSQSVIDWATAAKYMAAQILGGIAAALTYGGMFWDVFNLAPATGFTMFHAGMAEFFYTFFLVFVVLNTAVSKKNGCSAGTEYYGLAIGFSVIAGGYGAGHISGGCFNPAVAIGIDLSSAGVGFGYCIAYTLFELAGAAVAVLLFRICRPGEKDGGDINAPPPRNSRLVSEFIGTFMLVLTVGLNVIGGSKAPVWSIAAALMCSIFALGNCSGGHFNPAVTTAITVAGADPNMATDSWLYMLSQFTGGMLAAITYSVMEKGATFPLAPGAGHTWSSAWFAEFVFTFVLCYVVLCVACCDSTKYNQVFGLAIASCVTAGGYAIGGVSGGSLNPAVSFGLAMSSLGGGHGIFHMVPYIIVELAAGAVAAVVYKTTHAGLINKQ